MTPFSFSIEVRAENGLARAGVIRTAHGEIKTPAFVTVATKGTAKALTPEMLAGAGVQVALANTYHMYLQPGDELVQRAGGLGKFMQWSGPTMTDSGGFQVFSLGAAYGKDISKITKITDPNLQISERSIDSEIPKLASIGNDGVSFRSHLDGSLHYITPERSIEIQHNLGADMIFAFDECTSPAETERYQEESLERTHAWAKRSLEHHHKLLALNSGTLEHPRPQALFGIVQGARFENLRKKSAEVLRDMKTQDGIGFDGFGIGGSFAKIDMESAVEWTTRILPEEKPRHLLGIGEPEDLLMGIERGIDLFDCVLPTRNGRNGTLYTKNGKINIMNAQFVEDFSPVDEMCGCYTCKNYTRAYLSHLFRAKEMLAATLSSLHNVYFLTHLCMDARDALIAGNFEQFKNEFMDSYAL